MDTVHHRRADRLRGAVLRVSGRVVAWNRDRWAAAFAAAPIVHPVRFDEIFDWYCANLHDRWTPKAYTPRTLFLRWERIFHAYARAHAPPAARPAPEPRPQRGPRRPFADRDHDADWDGPPVEEE